jgi:DNA replication protein DnaD
MEYLIDKKLISLFLGVEETDSAVADYLDKYEKKIIEITDNAIYNYLKEDQGLSDDEIRLELQRFAENKLSEDSRLLDNMLHLGLTQKIEIFNKQIYDYYRERLSEEQKAKVNEYIATIQSQINADFEEDKEIFEEVLAEVVSEYNSTGTVKSWEEFSSSQSVDESSVQQVSPAEQTQSRPIQIQLTQKPNVDPVLGI